MISASQSSERPRERCLQTGAHALSLRECLAVLLGTGPPGAGCLGVAATVLNRHGSDRGDAAVGGSLPEIELERGFFTAMEYAPLTHLQGIRGLGDAGRARILAAFELGRRYHRYRSRPRARRSAGTANLCDQALEKVPHPFRAESREWLGFVPLHRDGRLGELCVVETGVRTHVNTDAAELFARILSTRPNAIVLFHNHPSGVLTPSGQDLHLTDSVRKLCREFGIELLAHWIVSSGSAKMI